MNPAVLMDHARATVAEFPEFAEPIGSRPDHMGRDGILGRLHKTFKPLGISREDRLGFVAYLFGMPSLNSFKDLTVAQGKTLLIYRDQLKELYGQYGSF